MRAAFLVCAGIFAGFNFAQAQTAQPAAPIDRPLPNYPESAGHAEGFVKLHFTIARDGHVADASVIESSPPGLFDAAALAGVKQWTYRPRLVDGHAADQPDNAIVLRFKPPADDQLIWLNPEPPMYPRKAYEAKVEGTVKVGFDITDQGDTTNVHVLESTAAGVFDAAAIEDVRQRVYQPATVGGQARGIAGQSATIDYRLASALIRPSPTHKVIPVYPPQASNGRMIGFCAMSLTIADDGWVSDAVVEQAMPRGVFERSCQSAMKRWKFETRQELGAPVAQHLKYMINFRFHDEDEKDVHYLKPGQWIVLDYTLTADGHAKDIKLVEQSEPGLPVDKAAEQLKDTKLNPIVENGVAVEKEHLRMRIE